MSNEPDYFQAVRASGWLSKLIQVNRFHVHKTFNEPFCQILSSCWLFKKLQEKTSGQPEDILGSRNSAVIYTESYPKIPKSQVIFM